MRQSLSHVLLFAIPWTIAHHPALSTELQNTAVGSHSILPGDLPDTGTEPESPELHTDSLIWGSQNLSQNGPWIEFRGGVLMDMNEK